MKKSYGGRSNCPINYSLELLGDSWSLLIIRDIVYFGKKTFGEFVTSGEGIARNILTNRLTCLTQKCILVKRPHPDDGRKDVYELTERGLDLIPILLDMADWGVRHALQTDAPAWWIILVRDSRETMIPLIRETVKNGGSIFAGEHSVVNKLTENGYSVK